MIARMEGLAERLSPSIMKQEIVLSDVIDGLESLPSLSFNLAFADAPYNAGFSYENHDDKMPESAFKSWTARWFSALFVRVKLDGSLWVLIPDSMVHHILTLAEEHHLHRINWIIWHYRFGVHTKEKFINSKTHLLWFSKTEDSKFYFDAVAEESDRKSKYNDLRTWAKTFTPDGMRPPFDVWSWPRVVGNSKERVKEGPNQVPDELLFRMLACCTQKGDKVVEAFSGTGSLADVCARMEREYIGFDNGPKVTEAARARLIKAQEFMKARHDAAKNVPQT